MSAPGYLVWNPDRGMPTVSHDTYDSAHTEALRLSRENPGSTFYVMSPLFTPDQASAVAAFSQGFQAAMAEARESLMQANREARLLHDQLNEVREEVRDLHDLGLNVDDHQATVADCLLWFDGFSAAWPADRICHTPHRAKLVRLNTVLQDIQRARKNTQPDQEIPF